MRDPSLANYADSLDRIFDHDAQLIHHSLARLAVSWRSERMVEQLEKLDGIGQTATSLERLAAELGKAAEDD